MQRFLLFAFWLSCALGCDSAKEADLELSPLKIKELSYVLDGGSIYAQRSAAETQEEMCVLVVYPESPVIDRCFPEAEISKPVVVLAADSDSLEDGVLASKNELADIVHRISLLKELKDGGRAIF